MEKFTRSPSGPQGSSYFDMCLSSGALSNCLQETRAAAAAASRSESFDWKLNSRQRTAKYVSGDHRVDVGNDQLVEDAPCFLLLSRPSTLPYQYRR